MKANQPPQNTGHWRKFPLHRYLQLWSQLVLQNSVLNCKVKHPSTAKEKLLTVAPNSLCKEFLHMAHNAADHQGTDKTIARLSDFSYWVGIAKDVGYHCTHCVTCQMVKAPARPPAPLQPIVTSWPWEMVDVDILHKVPMSSKINQYLLMAQDYFSKGPFAMVIPDQKAPTVVKVLRDQIFTIEGPPQRLRTFRPREKFWKPHSIRTRQGIWGGEIPLTSYHPMGEGLVERMNHPLLSLLRTLIER